MTNKGDNGTKYRQCIITVGHPCNQHCVFCNLKHKDRLHELSFEEVCSRLKRSKQEGFNVIEFTGGEPTLRKDILKIFKYAKETGFEKVFISTNGRLFSYKEFTKKAIENGLTGAFISVHGLKETHNSLTSCESFEQIVEGIKNLKDEIDFQIQINCVLVKQNLDELEKFVEFFKAMGIWNFLFIYVNPTNFSREEFEDLVPNLDETSRVIIRVITDNKDCKISTQNIPFCFMGGYENHINLNMLNKDTILIDEEFGEKGLNERAKGLRSKGRICKICKYNSRCVGVFNKYMIKRFTASDFSKK